MANPAMTIQPYHITLANSTLFENVTYAISQVQFAGVPTSTTHAYATADTSVQKHVSLLDHIALLLVYKAKGDVVATRLLRERASFTVVWAKNSTYLITNPEENYLGSLLGAFVDLQQPIQILNLVAGMCKIKILTRVKKLVNAAPRVSEHARNFFSVVEWHPKTEAMRHYLVQRDKMRSQPLADGLDNFLAAARGLRTDSRVESFINVLVFSYWLSLNNTGPKLDSVPGVNPILFRRVKKLGAWLQACVVIHAAVKSLSPEVRKGIKQRQLAAPSLAAHRPYRDTIRALNTWTVRYKLPRFEDFQVVQDIYPKATPGTHGPGPELEIVAAQHCELTVGLELWRTLINKNQRQIIGIGCSKASCFYCKLWIEEFNKWVAGDNLPNKMVLRGQHDKLVLGWAMPANTPAKVRDGVLEGIGKVMQEIYTEAGGPRRRSDSQSPPSHTPGANQATELDDSAGAGWGNCF
ncbi:MAG: hypothetical protein Q9171_002741 [Xanthocarpia ochracea]